jgi:hypothetical protein
MHPMDKKRVWRILQTLFTIGYLQTIALTRRLPLDIMNLVMKWCVDNLLAKPIIIYLINNFSGAKLASF